MPQENPLIFLVDVVLDLYIAILLIRFLMQQVRADFYNPISQFIVKATHIPVSFMRRFVPGFRGMDIATLVLVVAFIFIKLVIITYLKGAAINMSSLLIYSLYNLIHLTVSIFIFAIFLHAILSWINPDPYNPVMSLLYSLTNPILKHVRRHIPPISGLDLSPMIALIGLMFLNRVITYFFQMI